MLFGKKSQQQARGFQFKPRFYDEQKEEFKSRVAEAKKRYHNESDEEYVPSRNFNFRSNPSSANERDPRFETNYGKVNPIRLVVLIALLAAISFFMLYL